MKMCKWQSPYNKYEKLFHKIEQNSHTWAMFNICGLLNNDAKSTPGGSWGAPPPPNIEAKGFWKCYSSDDHRPQYRSIRTLQVLMGHSMAYTMMRVRASQSQPIGETTDMRQPNSITVIAHASTGRLAYSLQRAWPGASFPCMPH